MTSVICIREPSHGMHAAEGSRSLKIPPVGLGNTDGERSRCCLTSARSPRPGRRLGIDGDDSALWFEDVTDGMSKTPALMWLTSERAMGSAAVREITLREEHKEERDDCPHRESPRADQSKEIFSFRLVLNRWGRPSLFIIRRRSDVGARS